MGRKSAVVRKFQLRKIKLRVFLSRGPELTLPTLCLRGRAVLMQRTDLSPQHQAPPFALSQPKASHILIPHLHPTSSFHLFSAHCFCPLALQPLQSPLAPKHWRHFSCWGIKCDLKIQFNKNN